MKIKNKNEKYDLDNGTGTGDGDGDGTYASLYSTDFLTTTSLAVCPLYLDHYSR